MRSYAPDFVSGDTLAYRLDCSLATIQAYVKEGLLPPPKRIGGLVRWDFSEVRAVIEQLTQLQEQAPSPARLERERVTVSGTLVSEQDPFIRGLRRGT